LFAGMHWKKVRVEQHPSRLQTFVSARKAAVHE